MPRRKHIPNLFLIVGQPDNGKTTISNWFEKLLGCEVIHTDQLYHAWIAANYPAQLKAAKQNIRGHYPRMTKTWQREWNEYATATIIAALSRAKLDLVVEGWLMLYLPDDLRKKIDAHATVMRILMRKYVATAADKQIKPRGRDYTNSVKSLCSLMAKSKGVIFMRKLVGYQSFEDIRDFQGVSDSCGKLLALNLPQDMTGKTVLDVGCSAGYFAIRCRQRGAKVVGIDKRRKHVEAAARLATAVYRMPDVKFYHANFFKWTKSWKYDYVLAVNVLSSLGDDMQKFFDTAYDMLNPGGTLVVEMAVSCVHKDHPNHSTPYVEICAKFGNRLFYYPNEPMLAELTKKFKLTYRGRSVRMHGNKRRRVYHLTKPIVEDGNASNPHS
jgi:2-polyprenyl-3-methyl-5-hydroxy-6-metoxy-1,4-benzoquinol methylase